MSRRNPAWTRDELVVALDFYLGHRTATPGKQSQEIKDLSDALNGLSVHAVSERDARFRNPNGVYMKLMNFRRLDPEYEGVGLRRGARLEEDVWEEFAARPGLCREAATAILATATGQSVAVMDWSENLADMTEAQEGRLLTLAHLVRERSRKLVDTRKKVFRQQHGSVYCEACGFDFEAAYGERGRGFIECHHIRPLHELRPGQRTRMKDLALLCSNCHRMVHARRPWLTLAELRATLRKAH